MAGLEIAERHRIGIMIGPCSVPDTRTGGAAKEEVGGIAAVAGVLPHLRFAFGADLLGGETNLRGKGASAPRLALAAMTGRHADRFARARDADLAAAAGGIAGGGGHYSNFSFQGDTEFCLYNSIF